MRDKFSITGMTCSACSAGIERTVSRLNGVERVEVSLMGESMVVEYDDKRLTREEIVQTVIDLGYGASIYNENLLKERKPQPDTLKKRFFISLIFLIPLMYFSMGGMINLPQPNLTISATLQAIFALAVIIVDLKFFTSGTKALLKKVPNMDTLVAMGSGISYLYSLVYTILIYLGKINGHPHLCVRQTV